MSAIPKDIENHWTAIRPLFSIHNETEYDRAIERLNALLDEVGTDEAHPLYELFETLGTLIQAYEEKHHPIPDCSGVDTLRFLMAEHGLTPSGLPELGGETAVNEILDGKRELTLPQIRVLSKQFGVSSSVFI
jgi:HTH-type transcriptional regulator/antitoxin HigA